MATSAKERRLYSGIISQISDLGQYHWRGRRVPSKEYLPLPVSFHQGEDGDAMFHTSVLLQALSWRYKNTREQKTLEPVNQILDFMITRQKTNRMCIVRNVVTEEAYTLFPDSEKNTLETPSAINSGPNMKYYGPVKLNSVDYMIRYDVSLDTVIQMLSACYWVCANIDDKKIKEKAVRVAMNQYGFYCMTGWKISDKETGKTVRYGNHNPYLTGTGFIAMDIIENIYELYYKPKTTILYKKRFYHKLYRNIVVKYLLRSYLNVNTGILPDVWTKKEKRKQYNNYMLMTGCHAAAHGFKSRGLKEEYSSYLHAVQRLDRETEGEQNYYNSAVVSQLSGSAIEGMTEYQKFFEYNYNHRNAHPMFKINVDEPVPLATRIGYNAWEESPYEIPIRVYESAEFIGGEDALLAYWLY